MIMAQFVDLNTQKELFIGELNTSPRTGELIRHDSPERTKMLEVIQVIHVLNQNIVHHYGPGSENPHIPQTGILVIVQDAKKEK